MLPGQPWPCSVQFCGECLQPCLQVPSPLCPLCRLPFDPKKVDKAAHVEKQLASYKAPCRGCSKKVTLAKMRVHVSSCVKVQEQMANCPKFVPVVPTSQPIPSAVPNRSTFACPYCGARNLDQQELVKHCVDNHRSDPNRVVCPICSAMPWGDPSYKSANFLQHLLHRHKFSYDTFVVGDPPSPCPPQCWWWLGLQGHQRPGDSGLCRVGPSPTGQPALLTRGVLWGRRHCRGTVFRVCTEAWGHRPSLGTGPSSARWERATSRLQMLPSCAPPGLLFPSPASLQAPGLVGSRLRSARTWS
nr:RING finger protein 166 isoform X2 [Bubalus bubalis]